MNKLIANRCRKMRRLVEPAETRVLVSTLAVLPGDCIREILSFGELIGTLAVREDADSYRFVPRGYPGVSAGATFVATFDFGAPSEVEALGDDMREGPLVSAKNWSEFRTATLVFPNLPPNEIVDIEVADRVIRREVTRFVNRSGWAWDYGPLFPNVLLHNPTLWQLPFAGSDDSFTSKFCVPLRLKMLDLWGRWHSSIDLGFYSQFAQPRCLDLRRFSWYETTNIEFDELAFGRLEGLTLSQRCPQARRILSMLNTVENHVINCDITLSASQKRLVMESRFLERLLGNLPRIRSFRFEVLRTRADFSRSFPMELDVVPSSTTRLLDLPTLRELDVRVPEAVRFAWREKSSLLRDLLLGAPRLQRVRWSVPTGPLFPRIYSESLEGPESPILLLELQDVSLEGVKWSNVACPNIQTLAATRCGVAICAPYPEGDVITSLSYNHCVSPNLLLGAKVGILRLSVTSSSMRTLTNYIPDLHGLPTLSVPVPSAVYVRELFLSDLKLESLASFGGVETVTMVGCSRGDDQTPLSRELRSAKTLKLSIDVKLRQTECFEELEELYFKSWLEQSEICAFPESGFPKLQRLELVDSIGAMPLPLLRAVADFVQAAGFEDYGAYGSAFPSIRMIRLIHYTSSARTSTAPYLTVKVSADKDSPFREIVATATPNLSEHCRSEFVSTHHVFNVICSQLAIMPLEKRRWTWPDGPRVYRGRWLMRV